MILEISTEQLIDAGQIGWIKYREGDAIIKCKVIRTGKGKEPFIAHVTGYRKGVGQVRIIEYSDQLTWNQRAKHMMAEFRRIVGDKHFYYFQNPLASVEPK